MANYPDDMDSECILLCDAMNALPGITTWESCCGHGTDAHRIFFTAITIEALTPILQASKSSGWSIEVYWTNGAGKAMFLARGPAGPPDTPGGANDFSEWIKDFSV